MNFLVEKVLNSGERLLPLVGSAEGRRGAKSLAFSDRWCGCGVKLDEGLNKNAEE